MWWGGWGRRGGQARPAINASLTLSPLLGRQMGQRFFSFVISFVFFFYPFLLFPLPGGQWGQGHKDTGEPHQSRLRQFGTGYGHVKRLPPLFRQRDNKYEITHTHQLRVSGDGQSTGSCWVATPTSVSDLQ